MRAATASAVGRLAAPVTVLTVCHDGRTHGTTVSTLTTVSRTPLLLTASLPEGSDLAHLMLAEGRFAVNVLSGGQRALARRFADRDHPAEDDPFEGLAWRTDRYSGAPLLDGALAHYSCRVRGSFLVGDHEVLLGLVVRAHTGLTGHPLLSYDGELRTGAADPELPRVPDLPTLHPKETATL
ncbi:flavin reductase family protein [Streptomyces graminilatus]|uniref:flavin reductase family protein n=1 Tax=Streptomyces graminilatus TaxID=1464070 RepID=UPI0007C834FC|nr:flavin reductase family protein [Streptomyces graminilatus]